MPTRRVNPLSGSKRTRRLKKKDFKIELESHIAREVVAVIYLGLAVIFYLIISGKAGWLGEHINNSLRFLFGIGTLALPVLFLLLGLALLISRRIRMDLTRYIGIALIVFSGLGLIHLRTPQFEMLDFLEQNGGAVGFLALVLPRLALGDTTSKIILITVFIVGILITFEVSFRSIISLVIPDRRIKIGTKSSSVKKSHLLKKGEDELNIVKPLLNIDKEESKSESKTEPQPFAVNKPMKVTKRDEPKMKVDDIDYSDWEFPPLNILSSASSEVYVSDKVLKENAEKIKEKLGQFDIPVSMKDVNIGPTVLQYTLQPHEGIKLNKITALKNDLALALAAKSIRMEAPIPGKALVGIEVPNDKRMVVHLRELIESEEFDSIKSKLRLVVGRDVSGAPVIDDLTSMPHLLIAGATGSGKSVGMNAFLISLLYQNSPQDLKFIMIDPKRVELTSYNGIPHLLTPVITDPEKAHSALKWAVAEMNRRYRELSDKKYRNIEEYNQGEEKRMYKIIIVIDELADLMMQATKKETEALICRIAQMARAVGIHLIIATQRPSVDVITGVIKANIPTRIAFTVTSGVDSRTIIDSIGAEDLLGMGDMLYMPGNMSQPIRVQGVYVSSKEIERVTNRVKLTTEPAYDDSIVNTIPSGADMGMIGMGGDGIDQDALYNDALQVIKDTGKASASLLQRRLSVGYARAARLLDILEDHGLIGPANGAKPREIFISDEESE